MKSRSIDIVVVGSGGAGLGAAIAAAEKGASVVVLEKRSQIGGISVTGMGIFAVESRLQKLKNHSLTKSEAFHYFMDCTHWRADARLVAKFVNRSAETIDWLEKMGIKFTLLDINWGQGSVNQTGHVAVAPSGEVRYRGGVSNYMIQGMLEQAKKLGVEVLTEVEMVDLRKENGRISGVVAKHADGTETLFETKACVMASGGYSTNPEMLLKYDGRVLNKTYFCMHTVPLDGKGIELAWKVGAGSDGMCIQQSGYVGGIDYKKFPDVKRVPFSHLLTGVVECPMLYVNLDGKRFIDEAVWNKTYRASAIARQKGVTAYCILDGNGAKYLETEGVSDVGYMDRETNTLPNVEQVIQENAALGTPYVIAADSIEELAEKMGVPVENLTATVEAYNADCRKGFDTQFGKEHKWLQEIRGPKYYALKMRPEGYGTVGGIKINDDCEALTPEGDPIPGLYAAGDCANDAVTYDYSLVFKLWGSTLGLAVNTGRFAGESAGDYVKSWR